MVRHQPVPVSLLRAALLCSLVLSISSVSGDYTYYGNEIRDRGGPATANETTSQRCWIDDFQKSSQPGWGYLACYRIYIGSNLPSTGPPLRVQVWTNTSTINKFLLKWEKRFSNYSPGRAYNICVETGEVVEVTEYDRIGFTNEGIIMPVSYNFEIDDPETMSTAHRTYWTFLNNWNKPIPKVGDFISVDNNAVRGTFSIGVNLTNTPPLESGLVYVGYDLKPRSYTEGTSGIDPNGYVTAFIDTKPLVEGRLRRFMYKLDAVTQRTDLYLFVLIPSANYKNASVEFVKKVTHESGPSKTYTVELTSGPLVNSSFRIGWLFNGQNPLFKSFETGLQTYQAKLSTALLPPTSKTALAPDSLSRPYSYSIGVVIDTNDKFTTGKTSDPVKFTTDKTSNPVKFTTDKTRASVNFATDKTREPVDGGSGCVRLTTSNSVFSVLIFAFGWIHINPCSH